MVWIKIGAPPTKLLTFIWWSHPFRKKKMGVENSDPRWLRRWPGKCRFFLTVVATLVALQLFSNPLTQFLVQNSSSIIFLSPIPNATKLSTQKNKGPQKWKVNRFETTIQRVANIPFWASDYWLPKSEINIYTIYSLSLSFLVFDIISSFNSGFLVVRKQYIELSYTFWISFMLWFPISSSCCFLSSKAPRFEVLCWIPCLGASEKGTPRSPWVFMTWGTRVLQCFSRPPLLIPQKKIEQ